MVRVPGIGAATLSLLMLLGSSPTRADFFTFNNQADNTVDSYGWYYVVCGGALGGGPPSGPYAVMQIHDDFSTWGGLGYHQWADIGMPSGVTGLAVTMYDSSGTIVFDNNGLENPDDTVRQFYNRRDYSPAPGADVAYSFVNNYDLVTGGYMELSSSITVKKIVAYFDEWGFSTSDPDFQQDSSWIAYRMNIYSTKKPGSYYVPMRDSFTGDIFSSDYASGTWSWSDTGVDRITSSGEVHDIYRLVLTLDNPITLAAGRYFFEHDAYIVPEPSTLALLGLGLPALAWLKRRRRH